ncbi:hypothetical protein LOTGIDRAFT_232559 [Lottia gigantea]|uniref:Uncharacterized protein n=1 Tax=Lottia gigantea TaxID=225164 RepID=V4AGS7_LOTGI|nr:hypothetical protein LOTGIDRAFT_232559 [Lottia gigantea]ESO94330.1 hypothetical protein LOTGIDRAFT_232559 [Lottia gigantea]
MFKAKMLSCCQNENIDIILTFGGVGYSATDIVPEVTKSLIEREALGLSIAVYKHCLDNLPLTVSLLSRGVCGVYGTTLIINLSHDSSHLENCLQILDSCIYQIMRSLKGSDTVIEDYASYGHRSERLEEYEDQMQESCRIPETQQTSFQHQELLQVFEDSKATYGDQSPNFGSNNKIKVKENQPTEILNQSNHCFEDLELSNELSQDNSAFLEQTDWDLKDRDNTAEGNPYQSSQNGVSSLSFVDKQHVQTTESNQNLVSTVGEISNDIISLHNYNLPPNLEEPFPKSNQRTGLKRIRKRSESKDVYNFDSNSDSDNGPMSQTQKQKSFKKARIHNRADQNKEVSFVPVGQGMIQFLHTHPAIQGIYLNKGKRHIKKNLVNLKRQESAVDKGSWERQGHKLERNRFDDYFEATDQGKEKSEEIGNCLARDEYVVNWYVWCPGRGGNCQRKCGGYGTCLEGCPGMSHKQDRHNCSFLLNLKIFLSDLTKWRIQITGSHVPDNSSLPWQPPSVSKQLMNQSTKDFIISKCSTQNVSSTNIQEAIMKEKSVLSPETVLPKRKISRVMYRLKRQKSEQRSVQSPNFIQFEDIESQSLTDSIQPTSDQSFVSQSSSHPTQASTAALCQEKTTLVIPSINRSDVPKSRVGLSQMTTDEENLVELQTTGPQNVDVSQIIQNSSEGGMTNSDLQAVLLSLYNT